MMIIAHLSQTGRSLEAVFRTNAGDFVTHSFYQNPQTAESEAQRQLDFLVRNMIATKLLSYLNQRRFALRETAKGPLAENLYNTIYFHRQVSYRELRRIVKENHESFLAIQPGQISRFLKHYNSIVEPVIQFCIGKEIKGE